MVPVYVHASDSLTCQETETEGLQSLTDAGHAYFPAYAMDHFKAHPKIGPMKLRRMDRASRMVCSGLENLQAKAPLGPETGLFLGTFSAGSDAVEDFLSRYLKEGPLGANPMLFPNTVLNAPIGQAAIHLGWQGPNSMACQNFLAGLAAVQAAVNHISTHPDQVLVSGAVDILSPFQFQVWKSHPTYGSRFVLGEGCCLIQLSAQESGKKILGFTQGRITGTPAFSFAQAFPAVREKFEQHWQRYGAPDTVWEFRPDDSHWAELFQQLYPNLPAQRACKAGCVGFGSYLAPYHLIQAAQIPGNHDITAFGLGGDVLILRLKVQA
ncbi:MAG: hypothetical protein H6510_09695 [Acidobacteria bacterium]|nr:hypothetical protein [Acidobacteriota bacterium]MCB9398079.1 hypothetical protein [Acidobacteriota bacterium]